jgi:hypothetical protein
MLNVVLSSFSWRASNSWPHPNPMPCIAPLHWQHVCCGCAGSLLLGWIGKVGAQQRCLAAHANVMVYGDFSTNCLISCIKNAQLVDGNKVRDEAMSWVKNGNLAVAARNFYFESRASTSLEIDFRRGIIPFLVPALPKYVSHKKAVQCCQKGPVLGQVHLAKGPFSIVQLYGLW